ncbi:MAG: TauD/TfdA family dioxygenase [Immundisolibacterales bacterium]|nr:TauD/TfdA family dioxygenase [Immundisolibacterales bacterium]
MRELLTTVVDDPAAWRGDRMAARSDWVLAVEEGMVEELEAAATAIGRRRIALFESTRDDFPLARMHALFRTMLDALEGGRGFVLLRGLPVERWSEDETRAAIWGLGTHLGRPVGQDLAGSLLHDVRDIGRPFGSDDSIRYFQTRHAIRLHTDGGDIFVLACVRRGAHGGTTLVVSAVEVFNELVRRRPDLAVVLQKDFWVDARGQRPDGARCQVLPVYTFHAGRLSVLLKAEYIYSAQRFDEVPRLTPAQIEALELFHRITEEPGMALELELEPGDVLLASNHTIVHGRTAFEDRPDPLERRHLMRLWLTIPNGRPLPPHYADTREYAETYRHRMPA